MTFPKHPFIGPRRNLMRVKLILLVIPIENYVWIKRHQIVDASNGLLVATNRTFRFVRRGIPVRYGRLPFMTLIAYPPNFFAGALADLSG